MLPNAIAETNTMPVHKIGDQILMGKIHILVADSVHNATRARILDDSLLTWIGNSGVEGTVLLNEVEYLRVISTRKGRACSGSLFGIAAGYGLVYLLVSSDDGDLGAWASLIAIPGGIVGGLTGLIMGDMRAKKDTTIYEIE